jgi:hypothetical protein
VHDKESIPYDDDLALTDYVWWNYYHLMSDLEKKAELAIAIRSKIAWNKDPETLRKLHEEYRWVYEPDVEDALRDGHLAFRLRARERLLKERSDAVKVNRCPACNRIVQTPRERLCLWCGHDWREEDERLG